MDTLRFTELTGRPSLRGASIFLSASIPSSERWDGEFDPLEITDAVVAFGRAALTAGMHLVTAAHPTIAPLLLYVAAELPTDPKPEVSVYQSILFENVLPTATQRFETEGIASIHWTEAVPGESKDPDNRKESLQLMRREMLEKTEPLAACFIGGMDGINDEFELFKGMWPAAPAYPIGAPGGEARRLIEAMPEPPLPELLESRIYPTIWNRVLDDLEQRL